MPARGSGVPFLGRPAELARLDAALSGLGETPRAVVLAGDSGVGKSRLLSEFGELARQRGALVLAGACLDVGDTWPYHPLKLALRRLGGPGEATAVEGVPAHLVGLFDDPADGGPGDGAVLEQLHWGLCALAAQRALVLVLDDLQWVDSSTRRLVLTLLSGLTSARLLVLGAVRSEDLQGNAPVRALLHELRRSRTAELLPLDPLDREQTLKVAEAIAGGPLPSTSGELVWQRSGGNPFAIEELVRALPNTVALPDSLSEMVLSRVGSLPEGAREVLRAMCVAVRPVPHWLLLRVLSGQAGDVASAVRAAVSAGLVRTNSEGYVVRHRLVQEALQADLLPGESQELHRRFAEALTEAQGPVRSDQLAHHWRRAAQPLRALPAVITAAEDAERLHARGEAWSYWQDAVELADELDGRPDAGMLLRAAEAAFQADDLASAVELVGRVERLRAGSGGAPADGRGRAELGAVRAGYLAAAGRLPAAAQAYARVLADPGLPPGQRAEVEARSAEVLVRRGHYRAAEEHARRALALTARLPAAVESRVLASAALGFSQAYLEERDAGRVSCSTAVEAAEASGHADVIGTAYLHLADLLNGPLNELDEGIAVALRGAQRVGALGGQARQVSCLLASAANGLFRVGRWAQAAKVASDALDRDPTGAAAVDLLLARARIVMGMGDLDGAERDLRSAETLLADDAGSRQALPLATLHAGLAMWRQDPVGAREAVQRGLQAAHSEFDDVWLMAPLVWHGLRAEAEAMSRGLPADDDVIHRLVAAGTAVGRECAQAAPPIRDVVEGYALLDAAELSRASGRSDADAWRRSAEYWASRGHPYPGAYARLRQAEALLFERSRNREAADALCLAHRAARDLSARPLVAQIEALAARARIRLDDPAGRPPRARSVEGSSPADPLRGLTEREREVLVEIARGRSNREIGRHLYISERTAGVHVSHILAKLQARTRVEATAIYLRSLHHDSQRDGGGREQGTLRSR